MSSGPRKRRTTAEARFLRWQVYRWMLELTTEYVGRPIKITPYDRLIRAGRDPAELRHMLRATSKRQKRPWLQGVKTDYLPESKAVSIIAAVSAMPLRQRTDKGTLRTRIARRLCGYPADAVTRICATVERFAAAIPPDLTAAAVKKAWRQYHAEHDLPFLSPTVSTLKP